MKKGVLFKTVRIFVVFIVAIVIMVKLVKRRPKAERQVPVEKGRLVEVFAATPEDVQMVVESFGTVAPRESLILVAQVRGQIVDISPKFKEGGFVKKRTSLIQIDPRTTYFGVRINRLLRRNCIERAGRVTRLRLVRLDPLLGQEVTQHS